VRFFCRRSAGSLPVGLKLIDWGRRIDRLLFGNERRQQVARADSGGANSSDEAPMLAHKVEISIDISPPRVAGLELIERARQLADDATGIMS